MSSKVNNDDSNQLPRLKRDELHLWCCDDTEIRDPLLLQRYSAWLDEVELSRWQRFCFARHRHQFLVTRALVRFALSSYQPLLSPAEWRFGSNDYGRPEIANSGMVGSNLEFNLSHTNGLAVLAISHGGELGVDVEHHRRRCETSLVADRFFSESEARDLKALPEAQIRHRFFDLWTLKEAYIKARGMGLAIPLDSFSFDLSSPARIDFTVEPGAGDQADGWQFWQARPTAAHKIAIAYRNDQAPAAMQLKFFKVVADVSVEPVNYTVFNSSRTN